MTTHIQDTQDELRKGLNTAANIITSSMGQAGSTVIISNNRDELNITKDGVSIAKSIKLTNPVHNIGAQLLISAAHETVEECGDGTTLTSLLLQNMVNNVTTRKEYEALEQETKLLQEYIKENTSTVTTVDQIEQIAMTSTNSEEVSSLFREIYSQTSFDTHIELERTEEKETTITIDKGYRFEKGFNNGWEITDTSKQIAYYENPFFYTTIKPLHTVSLKIKNLVESALQHDVPLVFIAEKYSREFKRFMHLQVMNGSKLLMLDLPSYAEGRQHELDNIKAYLSEEGSAQTIMSTPYHTIITNNDHPQLDARLTQLKELSNNVEDPIEAKAYLTHYHRLSGNIATIWVGGKTKESRNELYDRIEDAVGATKTAIKHGYTLGMGKTLYNFCILPGQHVRQFKSVWQAPYKKIVENAHLEYRGLRDQWDLGEDLTNPGRFIDLRKKGIIDPSHTLITALNNALANTKLVLNTKYILYNELQ